MLFVCRPKFCLSIVFSFPWGHFNCQEKLKTMLMQNFGMTNKEHYGMLWYFLESSIVNSEIRLAKQAYYQNSFNQYTGDSRKTWQTINELTSRKSGKTAVVGGGGGKTIEMRRRWRDNLRSGSIFVSLCK